MAHWENIGLTNEWYTPKYIFDALECEFDLDVAAPIDITKIYVPSLKYIHENSLDKPWQGFVWMNPPFGGRNGIKPWLDKIFLHGNGLALTPDRTSAQWWQEAALKSDAHLQIAGKVRFIDENGNEGKSPSVGTTLFAYGNKAVEDLKTAQRNGLGILFIRIN